MQDMRPLEPDDDVIATPTSTVGLGCAGSVFTSTLAACGRKTPLEIGMPSW